MRLKIERKNRKRQALAIIQKILYVTIGIPIITLEKFRKRKRDQYWKKREERLFKHVVKEMIKYIEKALTLNIKHPYFIFNEECEEIIDFSNAFYVYDFFQSWEYKNNKKSILYKELFLRSTEMYLKIYERCFQYLKEHFKQYDNLTIVNEVGKTYLEKFEYFIIEVKEKS